MTTQSLLIEAARCKLIPHIMRSGQYEEHREGVDTAGDARWTHNIYHCFRPATLNTYHYLEIDFFSDNRFTRITWGTKMIKMWTIDGKQFKATFNQTLRQNAPTQEFATFDDMMDHAMRFVA